MHEPVRAVSSEAKSLSYPIYIILLVHEPVRAVSSEANSWSDPIYIILLVHEPVSTIVRHILGLILSI